MCSQPSDPPVASRPDTEVLDYTAASQYLGIKINTLYVWVHQKRVPHVRYGRRNVRFRLSDLQEFVAAHVVTAEDGV
jgi:excisionase family DNA binding protein